MQSRLRRRAQLRTRKGKDSGVPSGHACCPQRRQSCPRPLVCRPTRSSYHLVTVTLLETSLPTPPSSQAGRPFHKRPERIRGPTTPVFRPTRNDKPSTGRPQGPVPQALAIGRPIRVARHPRRMRRSEGVVLARHRREPSTRTGRLSQRRGTATGSAVLSGSTRPRLVGGLGFCGWGRYPTARHSRAGAGADSSQSCGSHGRGAGSSQ